MQCAVQPLALFFSFCKPIIRLTFILEPYEYFKASWQHFIDTFIGVVVEFGYMNDDDHTIIGLLTTLGVSRTEAATYLALLQLDTVSIRKIAAATGINRGTTYDALKRLVVIGLVSTKRRGAREYYTAESPEKIFDLIRDKRHDLLEASEVAKEVVPDLIARQGGPSGKPLVRYYEGDDGVVTILKDVLQTCRILEKPEYCAYSSNSVRQYLYRKFPQFTKQRVGSGIYVRVISEKHGNAAEPAELSERRWLTDLPQTHLSSYTLVYGNKVATISITSNDTPYGVVIEDEGVASMQLLLFNQLWHYIGD
jgi:HTH-type transcriptional regulator, sugar sensing transcriptional regulator